MEKTDSSKLTYFHFRRESKLPIYIKVNLDEFVGDLGGFFAGMGFEKLSDKEAQLAEAIIIGNARSRVLKLSEATPSVARQIDQQSSGIGPESVTPREGYNVYRYTNQALLVYSYRAKEWSMGCFGDFGDDSAEVTYKIIINRFLAWALVPHGYVGFWGVPVDEGMVVMNPMDAKGEATYLNLREQKLLSIEGSQKMKARFNIMRLNNSIQGKNIRMNQEELLTFLTMNSTFIDSIGLTVPVRQMIQMLSKMAIGLIHPEESFRPRADLSL